MEELDKIIKENLHSSSYLSTWENLPHYLKEIITSSAGTWKSKNISDKPKAVKNILDELTERQKDFENPGSYMEEEWYVKCGAKVEAFEEAISIVKKHL